MGISVLMSLYKQEKREYFDQAMESIVSQTLLPDEIVLIEDGPITEELEEAVVAWSKRCPFFKVHRFKENVQLGRALHKGVELCSCDLIARMDTDDIAVPDRLEKQYAYMFTHPVLAVLGGHIEEFDDAQTYKKEKTMPHTFEEVRSYGRYRNPVNHMTVMFRKEAVVNAGNYKHYPFLEDYHLWVRMMARDERIENLPEVLVHMRTNGNVYKRRGGFEYFRRYCDLRKIEYKSHLLTKKEYMVALVLSASITLVPSWLRKLVYRVGLRRK